MKISYAVAATAVLITTIFLPEAVLADCKEGICVSGHDEGNVHIIDFSTTLRNVTHFNFNNGGKQQELGPHQTQVSFTFTPGHVLHYAFQACSGGGFLGSKCTAWANFTHSTH